MSGKNTWLWVLVAVVLFVFIFFFQARLKKPPPAAIKVLPGLDVAAVASVQVLPASPFELRAERTNGAWLLTRPTVYPAESARVTNFLSALSQLTAAVYITPSELKNRPNADEEYGFFSPQATIILEPGNCHIHVGARTAPGDQVFLQVVGNEGIFVVDASLLNSIPRAPDDWRDTSLIDLRSLAFDRVAVTNGAAGFVLRRDPATRLWSILPPIEERADSAKIDAALDVLQALRIAEFVSDDPKADLDKFGLQPPGLQLDFVQASNTAVVLQFGSSPTNDVHKVYSRRPGQSAVFTIAADALAVWRDKAEAFRDPYLVEFPGPVLAIEIHGEDVFSLQDQGSNSWRVLPQGFPADTALIRDLLETLGRAPATLFKGVVIEPDLATYGLAPPRRRYVVKTAAAAPSSPVGSLIAEVDFGATQDEKVFARRADTNAVDANAVYTIKASDFERLAASSWQLRDRRIWDISTNELAGLLIRQHGKVRHMIRKAPYSWSLASGSQGMINDGAVEGAALQLTHLDAEQWVARGSQDLARYGLAGDDFQITVQLKSGKEFTVSVGGPSPSNSAFASVNLDGEVWIFEMPARLWQFVANYLTVPASTP